MPADESLMCAAPTKTGRPCPRPAVAEAYRALGRAAEIGPEDLVCSFHQALAVKRRRNDALRATGCYTASEMIRDSERRTARTERALDVLRGFLRSDAGRATLVKARLPVRVMKALRVLAERTELE